MEEAARLLRTAPLKVQAPQDLPALQADLNFVYAYVGAQDRIMENPERSSKIGMYSTLFLQLWDRWYAPLRKMERFKSLMREAGLVNYWKARGWPDLCHPTTGDDFECS